MTNQSFERTGRGSAIRIEGVEIVPILRLYGRMDVSESGILGIGTAEPVGLEITTSEGTWTIDLG